MTVDPFRRHDRSSGLDERGTIQRELGVDQPFPPVLSVAHNIVAGQIRRMFWFILSMIAVATSPIGRAIADRISGRSPASEVDGEELRWMEQRAEARILDLEDRIDAAERFLRGAGNH